MSVIDSFDRLPVGKYVDILKIDRDPDLADEEKRVRILAVLSGLTPEAILAQPIAETRRMSEKAAFLRRSWDGDMTLRSSYRAGDLVLVPTRDMAKMTTAQYIDFQELGSQDEHFAEALACMLIPQGCAYGDGYDFADVQAAIRDHLSVAEGLAVYAFFLVSSGTLIPDSLNYSRQMLRKLGWRIPRRTRMDLRAQIREAVALFRSDGDGSPASTPSAKLSGRAGTKYSGAPSLNSSISSPTGRTGGRRRNEPSKNGSAPTNDE